MRMKVLQIVEPFHQRWSKRDSSPGLHSDSRRPRLMATPLRPILILLSQSKAIYRYLVPIVDRPSFLCLVDAD